jgi:sugar-specific transcriptional regulator TrmB
MMDNSLLDTLKQIGLNLYERKLWLALLSCGTATAGELSRLAKVPHSRTYDVLESLEDQGFVIIQRGRPARYVAIEPFEALERVKRKIKEDTDTAVERISSLQKSPKMKDLQQIYKKGMSLVNPSELTGTFQGRDVLHKQLESMFKKAKKHISIITTNEGLKEIASRHKRTLSDASSRGVKIRIVAPEAKSVAEVQQFAEVKNLKDAINSRLAIIDDEHLVMFLTDDSKTHPSQDVAFWTQSDHAVSKFFKPTFENIWKNSE